MSQITEFQNKIYAYYRDNKRLFPWRDNENQYHVYLSEVMLQQTQTGRVLEKYREFLEHLPTFEALAQAHLATVLTLWQGLGYNRRAKFLKQSAEIIVEKYNGRVPESLEELEALPGIGPATARSVATFIYNKPVVFIETNIRSVFIHEFFQHETKVHDSLITPLVEQSLDIRDPRQWYYALMDYGVMLKQTHKNPSRKSQHHTKQSKFVGSDRQIRGACLRILTQERQLGVPELLERIGYEPGVTASLEKRERILEEVISEGFIVRVGEKLRLAQ